MHSYMPSITGANLKMHQGGRGGQLHEASRWIFNLIKHYIYILLLWQQNLKWEEGWRNVGLACIVCEPHSACLVWGHAFRKFLKICLPEVGSGHSFDWKLWIYKTDVEWLAILSIPWMVPTLMTDLTVWSDNEWLFKKKQYNYICIVTSANKAWKQVSEDCHGFN